ncbi:unnamed protein product [Diplocarpon coronariae]
MCAAISGPLKWLGGEKGLRLTASPCLDRRAVVPSLKPEPASRVGTVDERDFSSSVQTVPPSTTRRKTSQESEAAGKIYAMAITFRHRPQSRIVLRVPLVLVPAQKGTFGISPIT